MEKARPYHFEAKRKELPSVFLKGLELPEINPDGLSEEEKETLFSERFVTSHNGEDREVLLQMDNNYGELVLKFKVYESGSSRTPVSDFQGVVKDFGVLSIFKRLVQKNDKIQQ